MRTGQCRYGWNHQIGLLIWDFVRLIDVTQNYEIYMDIFQIVGILRPTVFIGITSSKCMKIKLSKFSTTRKNTFFFFHGPLSSINKYRICILLGSNDFTFKRSNVISQYAVTADHCSGWSCIKKREARSGLFPLSVLYLHMIGAKTMGANDAT